VETAKTAIAAEFAVHGLRNQVLRQMALNAVVTVNTITAGENAAFLTNSNAAETAKLVTAVALVAI